MKFKKLLITTGFFMAMGLAKGYAQMGIPFGYYDDSAYLDINGTAGGVLLSRIMLTSTADVQTIIKPAQSLLIYNTAKVADVTPGFYYWCGTKWKRILTEETPIIETLTTLVSDGAGVYTYTNEKGTITMINVADDVKKNETLTTISYSEEDKRLSYKDEKGIVTVLDLFSSTGAGPQGPIGPAGPKGDKGDQGIQGLPGTIGVTGAAGVKGDQGIQGIAGTIGATGAAGAKGDKGDQGLQGIQGFPGTIGATGVKGDKGDQGIQGIAGAIGAIGAVGAKGDKGDQGIQGIAGAIGATGATGAKGDQGLQGLPGTIGATGAKGDKGDKGLDGISGPTGPKGTDGKGINSAVVDAASGSLMLTYSDGIIKDAGVVKGPKGDIGATGPAGETGAKGSDATAVEPWNVQSTTTMATANNQNIYQNANVGIGNFSGKTVNAQLQLSNTVADRKIVLYEDTNNNNQFYGLGIAGSLLKLQIPSTSSAISFNAGTSATASKEVMRVNGAGNLGVGTAAPTNRIHIAGANNPLRLEGLQAGAVTDKLLSADANGVVRNMPMGTSGQTLSTDANGNLAWTTVVGTKGDKGDQGIQGVAGTIGATGATGVKGEKGDQGIQGLPGTIGVTGPAGAKGDKGDKGLDGISGPTGSKGTDGKGINSAVVDAASGSLMLTYSDGIIKDAGVVKGPKGDIGATGPAGETGAKGSDATVVEPWNVQSTTTMATANNQNIYQNANVGIGNFSGKTVNAQLQLSNTVADRKIVLYEDTNNNNQFYGLGVASALLKIQVPSATSAISFNAGTSATASKEVMRVNGAGNLGVGTAAPTNRIHIAGANNPLRLEGLQAGAVTDKLLSADANGVVHNMPMGTSGQTLSTDAKGNLAWTTPVDGDNLGNHVATKTLDMNSNIIDFIKADGIKTQFLGSPTSARIEHVSGYNLKIVTGIQGVNAGIMTWANQGDTGTTEKEVMRLNASGNLGVGTASPTNRIHVSGTNNPLRLEGLQAGAVTDKLLATDANGVVRNIPMGTSGQTLTTDAKGNLAWTTVVGTKGDTGAAGKDGIGGKTTAGTNIAIAGAGSEASPYVVNAILPVQTTDEFTASTGQTDFRLTAIPSLVSSMKLYINGVRIDKNAITINGNIVKYNAGYNGYYALMSNDNVIIDYLQ